MPKPNLPPNQQANAADAIAVQPEKYRAKLQNDLSKQGPPNTGNAKLTEALRRHLPILFGNIAVPDDAEEMRWRLFFAHSQDMLGFRADIFTGGPKEADHPTDKTYMGLRDRWPDGKTMLQGLAALWLNPDGRETLEFISNPFRPLPERLKGIRPALDVLRGPLGNDATRVFADAYDELKGANIAHQTNAIVRAYCQNAAVLAPHDYCFRTYLKSLADPFLPSDDISDAETKWVSGIQRDFYHVGPALAPYLVCDWLLCLWLDGQISWFMLYKPDSVFLGNAHIYLPPEATKDAASFIAYCRTLRLPPEWIAAPLWHLAFYNIPPRLVNEVIWLDNNKSSDNKSVSPASISAATVKAVEPLPTKNPGSNLSPSDIRPAVKTVLENAETALTSYEILERLPIAMRDRLISERGLPGAGAGQNFSAATLVTMAVDKLLPSKNAPYREYRNLVGQTFTVAGQIVKPGGSAIAVYRLTNTDKGIPQTENAAQGEMSVIVATHADDESDFSFVDPADYSEDTLTPPGQTADPNDPNVLVVSTIDNSVQADPNGGSFQYFAPLTATAPDGERLWVAFTSRHAMRRAVGDGPNQRQNMRLSQLVDMFLTLKKAGTGDMNGIVLDPSGPNPCRMTNADMADCLREAMTPEQARQLFPDTRLPVRVSDRGDVNHEMPIVCLLRRAEEGSASDGQVSLPVPVTMHGGKYLAAFTSHETRLRGKENFPFDMRESSLQSLCQFFASVQNTWEISGIALDPFEPGETILPPSAIQNLAGFSADAEPVKAKDILKIASPLTMISDATLAEIVQVLQRAGKEEAGAVALTRTDMSETLFVFVRPYQENTSGPLWHFIYNLVSQAAGRATDVSLTEWDEQAASLVTDFGIKLLPPPPPAPKKRKIGFLR